jgi:hypothetical protein
MWLPYLAAIATLYTGVPLKTLTVPEKNGAKVSGTVSLYRASRVLA